MKEKPIKKAWACIMPNEEWWDLQHSPTIVYAETRSKAKYKFDIDMDFDWSDPGGFIHIKARRSPANDLYAPKPDDVLKQLSDEQIKVIAHANGNQRLDPGSRDFYYCSANDKDLLELVGNGLMVGPQHTESGVVIPGNGYFYLTDLGKNAASSMLPRKVS